MVSKFRVFVTREIPAAGIELLRGECDVSVNPDDRVLTSVEIASGARGAEGLLCLLTDTVDDALLEGMPTVRVIANYAVGFNNIDVGAATRRGIPVSNTPGVLTETTADMAWSLLMAASRRIAEGDKFTRAGSFAGWGPMLLLGQDVYGKTLGLVGMGRIGEAMVRRARGFGMRILYFDTVRRSPADEAALGIEYRELDALLGEADHVSLHVPLSPETRHLISARELSLMKPSATLVNTSRGPVLDEAALAQALRRGTIFAAGLDVFEEEPKVHPGLMDLSNVVLVPHIASATIDTRTKMATMATANLLAGLRGEPMPNIVNPEAFASQ